VGAEPVPRHEHSRWFAYPREFDHGGHYLESTVDSPGLGPQARDDAPRLLQEWLVDIPGLVYDAIAIRPISAEYHGLRFGLVVEKGHGTDWVELYPDRLGFHEPWDGHYDT
jgi:formate hydrogenlyase regulatory protein HycA